MYYIDGENNNSPFLEKHQLKAVFSILSLIFISSMVGCGGPHYSSCGPVAIATVIDNGNLSPRFIREKEVSRFILKNQTFMGKLARFFHKDITTPKELEKTLLKYNILFEKNKKRTNN